MMHVITLGIKNKSSIKVIGILSGKCIFGLVDQIKIIIKHYRQ